MYSVTIIFVMKLAAFLEKTKTKRTVFAEKIGVTPGWITALCDGSGWPSRDVAEKIEHETEGAVTPNDFLSEPERKAS